MSDRSERLPRTLRIGDVEVGRIGFGAMRLTGEGAWGEPDHPKRARAVVRRAVELGIRFVDTAWFYGPLVANRIVAEAIHPYPRGLVLATKLGAKRLPDAGWAPALRPDELREGAEEDLRSLRVDCLDVVHLRAMPAARVPFLESLDALIALRAEGKIRHLALSNVNAAQLELALAKTPIVAVQNLYNVAGGAGALAKQTRSLVDDPEGVIDLCTEKGIAFVPFFPLASREGLGSIAKKRGLTTAQVALAWLLARSPVMLPIPGTTSVKHLEENWAARDVRLTPEELRAVGEASR